MEQVMTRVALHSTLEDEKEAARGGHAYARKEVRRPRREFRDCVVREVYAVEKEGKTRGQEMERGYGLSQEEEEILSYIKISTNGLYKELRRMREKVRWPGKLPGPLESRPRHLYCDFHGDQGHTTAKCRDMGKEVVRLLREGYMSNLLTTEGLEKVKNLIGEGGQKRPREEEMVIVVIIGGSDLAGSSQSAARKQLKAAKKGLRKPENLGKHSDHDYLMNFSKEEEVDELGDHEDALVISIKMNNYTMKRVLVDTGSSANILGEKVLEGLGIPHSQLKSHRRPLVGFGGNPFIPIGQITLPVMAEGEQVLANFIVVEQMRSYNAILGRPWLHAIKGVSSTLHQMVKFPTKGGVKVIRGDQRSARECYSIGMQQANHGEPL